MKYSVIAIIYNPNSTGAGEDSARKLAKELRRCMPKQTIELIETKHPGHGETLAYDIAVKNKNALVISSSGDGGYGDVINGIMRARADGHAAIAGLLPSGNANDHYKNVHAGDVVKRICAGDTQKIDVLKVQSHSNGKVFNRYAHSYIGFGLSSAVGLELNKTKLNPIKEIAIVLRLLLVTKAVKLKIDKTVHSYESIVFSNVDVMSKYLKISNPSSMTDGKFEVTMLRRRSKLRLLLSLFELTVKGVAEDEKASKFTLRTVKRTHVQTDGEVTPIDKDSLVHITIEPSALECIV